MMLICHNNAVHAKRLRYNYALIIIHDFVHVQALTVKVGRVKAYSAAEKAGLKTCDYIWQINGKEVFEMSHNECVKEVKSATTMLSLNVERLV